LASLTRGPGKSTSGVHPQTLRQALGGGRAKKGQSVPLIFASTGRYTSDDSKTGAI
jgi:hypothetical protein